MSQNLDNPNERNQLTWPGKYRAVVMDNKDPNKFGRVKVFIPDTMIDSKDKSGIWALPANNPCGGRNVAGDFESYYQGSCMIPPKGSWVYVTFEQGNPSEPRYEGACELENVKVLAENQTGTEYQKKWTLYKTHKGRSVVLSDDPSDERIILTGKKRLLTTADPSGNIGSVFQILYNQCVICIDERTGQEQILIEDYKGNFIKFDIEKQKLFVEFNNDINIHTKKNLNVVADENINITSKTGNITVDVTNGNWKLDTGGSIKNSAGTDMLNTSTTRNVLNAGTDMLISSIGVMNISSLLNISIFSLVGFSIETIGIGQISTLAGPLYISAVGYLCESSTTMIFRNAPIISDNGPMPPPPPPLFAMQNLVKNKFSSKMLRHTIIRTQDDTIYNTLTQVGNQLIFTKLDQEIINLMPSATISDNESLKQTKSDLIKANIIQNIFTLITKDKLASLLRTASDNLIDLVTANRLADRYIKSFLHSSENAITQINDNLDSARTNGVGVVKDISDEEIDNMQEDVTNVSSGGSTLINNIINKFEEVGLALTESAYSSLLKSLNTYYDYSIGNGEEDLVTNIESTITQFNLIKSNLKEMTIDEISTLLDSAKTLALTGQIMECSNVLVNVDSIINNDNNNIKNLDFTIFQDIKEKIDYVNREELTNPDLISRQSNQLIYINDAIEILNNFSNLCGIDVFFISNDLLEIKNNILVNKSISSLVTTLKQKIDNSMQIKQSILAAQSLMATNQYYPSTFETLKDFNEFVDNILYQINENPNLLDTQKKNVSDIYLNMKKNIVKSKNTSEKLDVINVIIEIINNLDNIANTNFLSLSNTNFYLSQSILDSNDKLIQELAHSTLHDFQNIYDFASTYVYCKEYFINLPITKSSNLTEFPVISDFPILPQTGFQGLEKNLNNSLQQLLKNIYESTKESIKGSGKMIYALYTQDKYIIPWDELFNPVINFSNAGDYMIKNLALAQLSTLIPRLSKLFIDNFVTTFQSLNPLDETQINNFSITSKTGVDKIMKTANLVPADSVDTINNISTKVYKETYKVLFPNAINNLGEGLNQALEKTNSSTKNKVFPSTTLNINPEGTLSDEVIQLLVLTQLKSQNNNAIEDFQSLGALAADQTKIQSAAKF